MRSFGIGQPVSRKEDPRFLTGRGRYVADLDLPRQGYAVFLFSPHAHARIRSIAIAAAAGVPGVYAVLTGQDWAQDGLGTIDPEVMPEDMGGPKGHRTRRPPLAIGRVRYVGERVAVIIAASEAQARDAAELVAVDYEPLPVVVDAADAVAPGAPLVHEDIAGNVAVSVRLGNVEAVEPAFARAAHITRLSLVNNRITAVTMEPRGCLAEYDPGTGRWTLTTSTQHVHGIRHALAHQILHVPESRIRVIARDVGGGFGMKGQLYPRRPSPSGRRGASAGQSSGSRPAARRSSATPTAAIRSLNRPNWRSPQTAAFSRCAGPACTMLAPISRAPARSRCCFH
jgi:carbon-monoxide dehydrogenase large subunit